MGWLGTVKSGSQLDSFFKKILLISHMCINRIKSFLSSTIVLKKERKEKHTRLKCKSRHY